MIKKYKKTLMITSVIILLPLLAGIVLWDKLPAQVATHWDSAGEPNGWSSKLFAVAGLPLILLAVQWFCMLVTAADPKRANVGEKALRLVLWICPAVAVFGCASTYLYALGIPFSMNRWISLLLGGMFIAAGNYLPKSAQNYTLGIKLPWTLNSEENWNRTHRFAGRVWVAGGVLVAVLGLLGLDGVILWAVFPLTLIPVVYSYILYRKGV